MGTTLSDLDQKLSEAIGDWIEVNTTTNIAANNSVISTTLKQYDRGSDNYFINWWIYINTTNNPTVSREVSVYDTSTGTLTIRGAALAAESAAVSFRLYRYSRDSKKRAINNAIRDIYPALHRKLEDRSLITGNILPPFNWSSTSALRLYTSPTGTLAKNTDMAYIWRGLTSAKVIASGADDVLQINSNDYPFLLDLMGKTITFKDWVYPEVTDDAFLTIYTLKADGTAQTLNSTTSCPAGKKTLLELEDQAINDDIQYIEFRLRVHTTTKYAYFDAPRVTGRNLYDYLLPEDFQNGSVSKVRIQTSGYSDDTCDDLHPTTWELIYNWATIPKLIGTTTYTYIRLPYLYGSKRQIELSGHCPLETLSADTDTISLDGEKLNLLIACAAYLLYEMEKGVPSSEDISRIDRASIYWLGKYKSLLAHQRMGTSRTLKLAAY